jgi:hypothetical protein
MRKDFATFAATSPAQRPSDPKKGESMRRPDIGEFDTIYVFPDCPE